MKGNVSMSGFFQGPSLMAHLLFIALTLGIAGPFIIDQMPSRALGIVLILALAMLYLLIVLLWGSRSLLFGRDTGQKKSDQCDDRSPQKSQE